MNTPQVNFYVFDEMPQHVARGLNSKVSDLVPLQRELLADLTKPWSDIERGEFMSINFNYLDKTLASLYRETQGTNIPYSSIRTWVFTKCIETYLWSLIENENLPKINMLIKHEISRLGGVIQDEQLRARYKLLGAQFHDVKPKRWQ